MNRALVRSVNTGWNGGFEREPPAERQARPAGRLDHRAGAGTRPSAAGG